MLSKKKYSTTTTTKKQWHTDTSILHSAVDTNTKEIIKLTKVICN
jgi:hypothetical protein